MSKYAKIESAVYSFFSSGAWVASGIQAFPRGFFVESPPEEFVRINVIPSRESSVNELSVSGLLMLEIFTPADLGPRRATEIADLLDSLISHKSVPDGSLLTQFGFSTLIPGGIDSATNRLTKNTLSVPFNHFGVS